MSRYNINESSGTSTLTLTGIIATRTLASQFSHYEPSAYGQLVSQPYQYSRQNSTQAQTVILAIENPTLNPIAYEEINQIFSQLAASQEILNSDVAQIIHDNLWDLYSR